MISIVIPIFNASNYLDRSIECIEKQTFTDWEVIFVDDGSTDSSAEKCLRFASIDKRITFVHQQNLGPSEARNNGLQRAKGEYVCFLDADDWFDSNFLQAYYDAVVDKSWDVVFQGFVKEKENGIICEFSFAMSEDTDHISKEDIICKLYKNHVYGWAWCKMYKREILEKYCIRYDVSLNLWEDELFTSDFMRHAVMVKTLDCRHYHYVKYETSLMHTNNTYLRRLSLSEIMNKALIPIANEELMSYINSTYNKKLKYSLFMSLMNQPDHLCDVEKKKELLLKYYSRCYEYPSLRWYNVLKNRFSYFISEAILMTHNIRFIISIFARL